MLKETLHSNILLLRC